LLIETIKAQVKRAQSEVLEPNGCIKHNCIGLVSFSSSMNAMQCIQYFMYMNSYMNYTIIFNILIMIWIHILITHVPRNFGKVPRNFGKVPRNFVYGKVPRKLHIWIHTLNSYIWNNEFMYHEFIYEYCDMNSWCNEFIYEYNILNSYDMNSYMKLDYEFILYEFIYMNSKTKYEFIYMNS
jgi:hypothetical protein